jgi:hypothetical protein
VQALVTDLATKDEARNRIGDSQISNLTEQKEKLFLGGPVMSTTYFQDLCMLFFPGSLGSMSLVCQTYAYGITYFPSESP